jgi:hypothetical protein
MTSFHALLLDFGNPVALNVYYLANILAIVLNPCKLWSGSAFHLSTITNTATKATNTATNLSLYAPRHMLNGNLLATAALHETLISWIQEDFPSE